MKKIIFIILVTVFLASPTYAGNGTVKVVVYGIKEIKGNIFIGLYDNAESFPKKGKEFKGKSVKVNDKKINVSFSDIPSGYYAIAIFHDANNNGILDKNIFGIPTEGYAFSGNSKIFFGSPSFNEAKFLLDKEFLIKTNLKY